MTELQQLIRDSNAMPPVIRADYLEDHGYDIEADWLRREGLVHLNPSGNPGSHPTGAALATCYAGAYGIGSGGLMTFWPSPRTGCTTYGYGSGGYAGYGGGIEFGCGYGEGSGFGSEPR